MMEVKHSQASQMEFRSTTNGLPANEVEDLDTIFDNDVGKSLTPPSDESNSSAPILNGIVKHSEELTSTEILDGMEIDMVKDETESTDKTKVAAASTEQNKENEEAEGVPKSDIDLFELGLEEESTEKVEEFKDAASVRDTGDDLDTLLSKINDLVEDCMETKAEGAAASSEGEIVEIPDDDVDDLSVTDVALKITEKSSLEMEVEEGIKGEEVKEAKEEVKAQANTEGELKEVFAPNVTKAIIEKGALSSREGAALDQMEVDADLSGDVVCLDSPLPEGRQIDEDELMIGEEEVVTSTEKPAAEEEKVSEKEKESAKMEEEVAVGKDVEPLEKAAEEKPKVIVDDEIYLIEDDDDNEDNAEVPSKDSDKTENKNEIADESQDSELKVEKDIESALDEICRTPEDNHTSVAVSEDKPPAEADDDDDDEIVCLDDSDKEDEVKGDKTQKTSTAKEVLVEKEEDKKHGKEEEVCMKVDETIYQKAETADEKASEATEKVKETSENAVVDEQSNKRVEANVAEVKTVLIEEISAKPVEDIVETSIEEISTKPVEKTLPSAVDEVKEKQAEEVAEKSSVEEAVEKPLEKTIDGAALEAAVEAVVAAVRKPVEAKAKTALEEQAVKEPFEAEKIATEAVEMHVEKSAKSVPEDDGSEADPKKASKQDDKSVAEPEKPSNMVLDDDIVILDDDEEEDEATSPAVTEPKESTVDSDKKSPPSSSNDEEKKVEHLTNSEKLTCMAKSSTILSDNSDNARDGVEEKQDNEEANETSKENIPVPSESNSCSSSSNLLKETNPEEQENREEQSEQPPAKRIRLSQDEEASSRHSTVSMDDTKSNTVDEDEVMEIKADEDNKSLKRVHSSESIVSDFKKPRTEEDAVKAEGVDVAVAKEEPTKKKKVEVKPLALYPPPKLDAPAINLSLDFLKRFKKSIHKMTKCDLEELVLQKIVEAIVHKSEFSEMRELIEKQEKVISSHRTKITELNKQFRDLEMVHNRVLKDLETKNSQFIMPVKITRAVGLQVFFPNKKYDQPLVAPSPVPTQTSPRSSSSLSNSTSSSTNTNTSSMPERSLTPVTPTNTPTSSNSVNTQVTGSNNVQAQVQRRGCVQKLTPMRPDTPRNSPLNRVGLTLSQQSMVATAKEAVGVNNTKTFNRGMSLKGRPPTAAVVGRSPVGVNGPPAALVHTPPLAASIVAAPKQSSIPPGIATKKPNLVKSGTSVLLASTRYQANQPKNYLSDPQATAQPLPPAATIITPPVPPSLTSTPKPVNKSVIDLTDEDDAVQTPTPSAVNNPRTAMAAQTPPSGAAAVNRGPYKVSVIPQQLLQQPKPNPPKQTALRPPVPIAPKPNGMAISVRTGPPHPSRYRHPAPLPNQPIHSTNPAWKLPPTRPTIRISNLDSGIVISWTIEDAAKEKYAESTSYQIYAYQETSGPPLVESWRHVGDVKAMLLPMAVTLTQFQEGQRYYFAVRAVDAHNRCGPFSFAKTWS